MHEEYVEEYQLVVLLAYPIVYFPLLSAAREGSICNKTPIWVPELYSKDIKLFTKKKKKKKKG